MSENVLSKSIQNEMKTVRSMIGIYCDDVHGAQQLCADCQALTDYAMHRLAHCRFGADKPTCAKCTVHCYKPDMREKIRVVMRRAGPKMMFRHPWLTLLHFVKEHRRSHPASVDIAR
jgi:disulfide oxidoreductase YuzD